MRLVNLIMSCLLVPGALYAEELRLVMIEQDGCAWCARWNTEIAPIWLQTDEGAIAPLRRVDLHAPLPEDLTLNSPVLFTPTFVLTEAGAELSRLEGYPGANFFWPIISGMIAEATASGAGSTPAQATANSQNR